MAFVRALRLLAVGSLITAAVAKPVAPWISNDDDTPLPLVIWHGLGDSHQGDGIRRVAEIADEVNPGTLTYIIRMDEDASRDRYHSFVGNLTIQVAKVCEDIAAHPILSTAPAIDALGFSQGGQFLRAYVERCNKPPVRSLVTFGSQHNGISKFRDCEPTDWVCRFAVGVLRGDTWHKMVQGTLIPAQYYRNTDEYEEYLENSNFLADINNEREEKNEEYKENIAKLENFVMYMFEDDKTVIPKETAWFEEVDGTEITPLRARKLYTEDWLGLRQLDRKGGLKFRTVPGEHMQLPEELLKEAFGDFYGPLNPHRGRSEPRPKNVHSDDL